MKELLVNSCVGGMYIACKGGICSIDDLLFPKMELRAVPGPNGSRTLAIMNLKGVRRFVV